MPNEDIKREVVKLQAITEPLTIEDVFESTGKYGQYIGILLAGNKICFVNNDTTAFRMLKELPRSDIIGKAIVAEQRTVRSGVRAGKNYFVPKLV